MPEPSDHTRDMLDRIATGRGFLRAHQPETALGEFEAAYDTGTAVLASSSTDAGSSVLRDFLSAAYWRSAAFTQLRMLPQADEQTNNLPLRPFGQQLRRN